LNKLIRIHEDTYNRLEALRGKRETFNEVVGRLCSVMETIKAIPDTLGPNHPLTASREDHDRR